MCHCVAAEVGDVIHAGGDAGDAFVVERAPLPAVGDGIGERTNFVGMQALQVFALAEEHAHVRTEKFVSGADEEIAIEIGDIDEAVRAVVDGVDVGESSGGVGEANDFFDWIDGADCIRGVADGDELCAWIYFAGEVIEIEGAIFFVNFGPADGDAFFFEREPGRDVGIVIEASNQDFIAGSEVAADRRETSRR